MEAGTISFDPTRIDWRGRDGLRYRASHDRHGVLVFRPVLRSVRDWIVWASGRSQYWLSKVQNATFNAAAITMPATLYFRLWTTTLSAASTGSSGTEASYSGYAAVAVTANTTNFPTVSSGAAISNGTAITWPANGAAPTNVVTYVMIADAATAGNSLYFGQLTLSATINQGDTPQMNAAALTVTET